MQTLGAGCYCGDGPALSWRRRCCCLLTLEAQQVPGHTAGPVQLALACASRSCLGQGKLSELSRMNDFLSMLAPVYSEGWGRALGRAQGP